MTQKLLALFILALALVACSDETSEPTPTPSASPVEITPTIVVAPVEVARDLVTLADSGVFISEVLVGIPGGNSTEFIELYNAGDTAVSLHGWSLWYQLKEEKEALLLAIWEEPASIPPYGHYLLVHEGQDVGQIPDLTFSESLSNRNGGLALKQANGDIVDAFGWGQLAPTGFFAGSPAPVGDGGASMERLPGGDAGNGQQQHDNLADFATVATLNPQNSGSPATPLSPNQLRLSVEVPAQVAPGATFDYILRVTNPAETAVTDVVVTLPLPDYFSLVASSTDMELSDGMVTWLVAELAAGETVAGNITVRSPLTYIDTTVGGYSAGAPGLITSYGPLQQISMAGGALPVAAARALEGEVVTIEGIATMYTGGFFAGSTGTKFYVEDESGGVQVYIPGGGGLVEVGIGDRVRVTGVIEEYRDSIELIPSTIPDSVEILGTAAPIPPTMISIKDNEENAAILGQLTSLTGILTRIEEFAYSYELDIVGPEGSITLVYIEKDTGISTEPLDLGEPYRVTGISEFYSGIRQIKPRLQHDLERVFAPIAWLELDTVNNVRPGQPFTYTITAFNYTEDALQDVLISFRPPAPLINDPSASSQPDGITLALGANGEVRWQMAQLPGDGGSVRLQLVSLAPEEEGGSISAPSATLRAAGLDESLESNDFRTFIGDGVPIWAIQGDGPRSPYARREATITGVVTGIFPGLQGFFVQDLESDENGLTSEGIFVQFGEDNEDTIAIPFQSGDLVQLNGHVRELSGQTVFQVAGDEDMPLLAEDMALPTPVIYDPPQADAEAAVYKESLEGMLVTLGEPAVAVGPTSRYGEYVLVSQRWGVDTVPRGAETGFFIMVDDGDSATHADQSTLPYAIAQGATVTELTGPLAFTFDHYKIEPIVTPIFTATTQPLPALPQLSANQLRVATFNVENLFDTTAPHPSDPPRPNREEYLRKLAKIADAILLMGAPHIIGLQEVENEGVLQDLIALEQLSGLHYESYLIEGTDSRGIDVAYLVRADLVTVTGASAFPEPSGLTSRPPLLITATIQTAARTITVFVLNNHFSSLSTGEEVTEPRRAGQAAWNVAIMEGIRATHPDALFVVMGDLNSFYGTLPITTLQDAGLQHVYDRLPSEEWPYTYIYQGNTQTLDHILLSPSLYDQVTAVNALPINANYPPPAVTDTTAQRVSDHDPLVITLSLE